MNFITENTELMTLSLKDNIHFGSSADEILASYGEVTSDYTNDDKGSFYINYKPDDTNNDYSFFGTNNGLVQIDFKYN